ncbi:methyltransferase [Streptomyces sp. CA-106110]|uniref:methyltransferase n=1 Tax=Streptomyces sp. CA-106110 TaxID=3240044 RepID=UPI003D919A55
MTHRSSPPRFAARALPPPDSTPVESRGHRGGIAGATAERVGCDSSPPQLDITQSTAVNRELTRSSGPRSSLSASYTLLPVCATAEEIALKQESVPETAYDVILAKEVLHHVAAEQRAAVVAGVSELLAPGGRFLVAMLPQQTDYPLWPAARKQTDYPLWPAARKRFTVLQPDPMDIAHAMEDAGLTTEVSYDTFPLSFTRSRYLKMVRSRFMSLMAGFDDAEIEDGIAQMLQEHGDADSFSFADRFAFVLGRRGA